MSEAILELHALRKSYPGVRALHDVSLTVHPGTVHALVGENGAGKSTLIKCLAGIVEPDTMQLRICGCETRIRNAADSKRNGLAFIHQERNLIEYFTAPENVFLGRSLPKRSGFIDRNALREQARAIFADLDVAIDLNEPVRYLTTGMRAMVAIARAFADEASVYFMDEPANALSPDEKRQLFTLVRGMISHGRSVVYVTHNLDDVFSLSDEITVLREGRSVANVRTDAITKKHLIKTMIGEEVQRNTRPSVTARRIGDQVLAVDGLIGSGIGPIDFTVRGGEILGIGGLVGSGRSRLLKLLVGAAPWDRGGMLLNGRPVKIPRSPAEAMTTGIVLIPEERRAEGLSLRRTVFENAILSSLGRFSRAGLLRAAAARSEVQVTGERVRLKTSSYDAMVNTLSGGNQQKVLFMRAVMAQPCVLLLDEPTKGVDIGARAEIYDLVHQAADRGVAILIVSSDFTEMLTLADRFIFIRDGRRIGCVDNSTLNQNDYLTMCYQGAIDE